MAVSDLLKKGSFIPLLPFTVFGLLVQASANMIVILMLRRDKSAESQESSNNMVSVEELIPARERFLNYVRARVSDPALAEDILQDSLLKALTKAPAIRDEERIVPWFYRVLHNAIVDTYRTKKPDGKMVDLSAAEEVAVSEVDEAELCQCFYDLLPTINPDYADLIESELQSESQDSESEATKLGITTNNLKVRRHRARRALRKRLEETCRTCSEHGCLDCTCSASAHFG